ncbi:MAG: UspA domain protein [Blastococcus sp.]|nr:UspA domain protein [Blastococcus sp.]
MDAGIHPIRDDGGRPRVVVGVDGSPGSRAALVHALTTAAQRGAELEVVSSYPVNLVWTGGLPLEIPDTEAIRVDTESRARALVDDVRSNLSTIGIPGVDAVGVRLVVSEGRAVPELLKRSEHADLLVVGSRGRGAMRSALLGSVALHCATHAPCPVLVVHPLSSVAEPPRVVVGVDGSAESRAALVAALGDAGRTGAEVEVVAAYFPTDYWTDVTLVLVQSVEAIRADLQRRTDELVADVVRERSAAGGTSRVRTTIHEGPAAEVLLQRAQNAQMLVVGTRGRGAIRGLLLGSVALHCAMHAPGPVMLVHPQRSRLTAVDSGSEPAMTEF